MTIWARIVFLVGLIFLSLPLFFPLWKIELVAPQYPEGLGMLVHCDKIVGYTEHDLENINLLNHYIGMAKIEPDSIPELKFMKYIIYGSLVFGLAVLAFNKRILLAIWLRMMIVIAAIGVYDFNEWERDYGYNLDPKAPIKIEGMEYKPPLIGSKQLLNITATSYPSIGGYGIAVSVALAFASTIIEVFSRKKLNGKTKALKQQKELASAAVIALLFGMQSCSPEQQPIQYGKDDCAHCRMKIMDKRYGAEIVTDKGKVFKFDSFECLVDFTETSNLDTSTFAMSLTTPLDQPGILVNTSSSSYLVSELLPSPMGAFITSFSTPEAATTMSKQYPGQIYNYAAAHKYLLERNHVAETGDSCCSKRQ